MKLNDVLDSAGKLASAMALHEANILKAGVSIGAYETDLYNTLIGYRQEMIQLYRVCRLAHRMAIGLDMDPAETREIENRMEWLKAELKQLGTDPEME